VDHHPEDAHLGRAAVVQLPGPKVDHVGLGPREFSESYGERGSTCACVIERYEARQKILDRAFLHSERWRIMIVRREDDNEADRREKSLLKSPGNDPAFCFQVNSNSPAVRRTGIKFSTPILRTVCAHGRRGIVDTSTAYKRDARVISLSCWAWCEGGNRCHVRNKFLYHLTSCPAGKSSQPGKRAPDQVVAYPQVASMAMRPCFSSTPRR